VPTYTIAPNPDIPKHDRPAGWRRWLPAWLVRRPRVVLTVGTTLVCHPDTVPVVATWLRAQGYDYRVQPREVGGTK